MWVYEREHSLDVRTTTCIVSIFVVIHKTAHSIKLAIANHWTTAVSRTYLRQITRSRTQIFFRMRFYQRTIYLNQLDIEYIGIDNNYIVCVYYFEYPLHAFSPFVTVVVIILPSKSASVLFILPNPIHVHSTALFCSKSSGLPPIFINFLNFGNDFCS